MGNSATSKVIGEETIRFDLMIDALLLFKVCVMFPNQGTISSLLKYGEGFSFCSVGDLMKVFKDAYAKFQAEHVGDDYMLRNLDVIVGGLQLSSASRSVVVE